MRISEIAREAGVGVETVRFYEQRGLIRQPAKPTTGGYRDYPSAAVRRIRFIRRAQQLGFSLAEIVELLELESGHDSACVDVRRRAEAKLEEVLTKIGDLGQIKGALETLIEACPGKGPARECSILEAISNGDLQLNPTKNGE
ncbi:MAG: MerR family transcriptional regulator [Rhodospirillales bacterium]|nr:MerR family transcriptional regulator [Rhodospirillales bacterium]MBI2585167.1 MerR family transcriptional regulator [Rhodospirillales bacterium]